jgi:hypothetical protein
MDYEPHTVHPTERHEDSPLRKTPGGECMCQDMLLSCYHGGYLWLNLRIIVDLMMINRITSLSMQGPDPQEFYPGKSMGCTLSTEDQGHLWRCQEGNVRLQGRFYLEWCSSPRLSVDCREVSMKELTYPSHRFCS